MTSVALGAPRPPPSDADVLRACQVTPAQRLSPLHTLGVPFVIPGSERPVIIS